MDAMLMILTKRTKLTTPTDPSQGSPPEISTFTGKRGKRVRHKRNGETTREGGNGARKNGQ